MFGFGFLGVTLRLVCGCNCDILGRSLLVGRQELCSDVFTTIANADLASSQLTNIAIGTAAIDQFRRCRHCCCRDAFVLLFSQLLSIGTFETSSTRIQSHHNSDGELSPSAARKKNLVALDAFPMCPKRYYEIQNYLVALFCSCGIS